MTFGKGLGEKGQVLVIIGVVMALGLYLISMGTDFEAALRRRALVEAGETQVLRNLGEELRETYDLAVRQEPSYGNVESEIEEFITFAQENSDSKEVHYLVSLSVQHSGTVEAGIQNFLVEEMEEVNVTVDGAEACSGSLSLGESCSGEVDGVSGDYEVEIFYRDGESGASYTRTYQGKVGGGKNHTALFYRTEMELGGTKLVSEDRAWSKAVQ
ncbi:MAG: hypothetical protein ACLFM9_04285 [Candidatus Aenigmatarchaeota archaeon]